MTAFQTTATQDSLKANFEDKPLSATGQCPLQQKEIAIFPVRYAIDEAAKNAGEPGPNPIPASWQGHSSLPRLNIRTYTLRQLRDGWLYVFNRTTNTLDEYQITGSSFSKVAAGEGGNGNLPACGGGASHLLYPRDSDLLLAYSSVQWTPYTRERMEDPSLQSRWARHLNLASYARTLNAAHCAPLKQLADMVADIDAGQARTGQRFESTTTPGEKVDGEDQYKPALGSNTVLGSVPDQDSALFIALDDTMGILDDLSMQAAGPAIELVQFEAEHMHRMSIAEHVELLAGADFTKLQSQMGLSTEEFHEFKKKAQEYLAARARNAADMQRGSQFSGITSSIDSMRMETELSTEYGSNVLDQIKDMVNQWAARSDLRHQVRFEKAQQYSMEKRQEMAALQAVLTPSLKDLITWLQRLGSDPICVFHDQTDKDQCLNLISNADAWLSLLNQDQEATTWSKKEYATPRTLLGLAIYNFNSELASAIEEIAKGFIEQDDMGLAAGSSIVKRSQEVIDVLSNEAVRNSRIFQRLSRPAQQAFDTLIEVASTNFEKLWQGFEYKLLPAISSRLGPKWQTIGFIIITTAVQTEIDVLVPVIERDKNYSTKLASWKRSELQLNRQITAQSRVAQMGSPHERNSAISNLRTLKSQLSALTREMPEEFKLTATAARVTTTEIQQRIVAIQTLGRAELAIQMELKARDYMAYVRRVNEWVANNLNRGFGGLITALNIWNVHAAMTTATADGEWSRDDSLNVGNMVATMLSGLTALSLMPMWSRMAQIAGEATVDRKTVQGRLVDVAAKYWNKGQANHLAMFRGFAVRAIAMSAFAVIASVAEGLQVWDEIGRARATDERILNGAKLFAITGFGLVGAYQLFAGTLGWFGGAAAGAVFAPWTLIAVAILGSILLISSIILDKIKREGFKLWLHRSRWSKSDPGYWPDTEEGQKDEMRALHEVLMRPTILAQTLNRDSSGRYDPNRAGVWLKLVLPPDVAGHEIKIHPVMVTEGSWFTGDRQTSHRSGMYSSYFAEGNWVPLDQLAAWDSLEVRRYRHQPSAQYQANDWRVWLVHVPHSKGMDKLEVEIHYPPAMLQRPDGRGYRFSIDLSGMRSGTLHENPYVHGQATEPNDKVERLVLDGIPARSRSIFNLGVI